ncbi:MAG: hypothetical protein PWQ77_2219 [Kosmotogales bacterium]|nr:hypothetical protein [Kosmotogales bacterium]
MRKNCLLRLLSIIILLFFFTGCTLQNLTENLEITSKSSSEIKLEFSHIPELDFLEISIYDRASNKLVNKYVIYDENIIINPGKNISYSLIIEGKNGSSTFKSPPIYITFYDSFPENGYYFNGSKYYISNEYFSNNENFLISEIPDENGYDYKLQIQICPKNPISPEESLFLIPETVIPIYIENSKGNFLKIKGDLSTEEGNNFEWEDQYAIIKEDLNSNDGYVYVSNWDLRNPIFSQIPTKIVLSFENFVTHEGFHELWRVLPFPNKMNGVKSNRLLQYKIEKNTIYPIQKDRKAIIFIHGHQGGYGFLRDYKYSYWGNYNRINVWSENFNYILKNIQDFDNFHFYEYIYDTNFYSASEYAEYLGDILVSSNLFKSYDEIYIIAHSMGSLVSRYLLDYEYENKKIGNYDRLKKVFTINGVHHGSPMQNFIQILFDLKNFQNDYKKITYLKIPGSEEDSNESSLLSFLQILYAGFTSGFKDILFSENFIKLTSDELISIIEKYPQIMSIFVNTGKIGPFKGGRSFIYDNQKYLDIINENEFNGLQKIRFTADDSLKKFNEEYDFFDKFIMISSYIEDIDLKSISSKTFIDSLSMSVLSNLIKIISEGSDETEMKNDGVVNVFSQEALNTGDKNEIWKYNNMNHLEIPTNSEVCKDILNYIINYK